MQPASTPAPSSFQRLYHRLQRIDPGTRGLLLLWGVFALLVVLGIHGSSLSYLNRHTQLLGEHPAPSYVLSPVARALGVDDYSPDARRLVRGLLKMEPRGIRIDEWGVMTPWALSQFTHEPAFPVVNENHAGGQSMLLGFYSPVRHVSSLARPATWGFLLLGPERGLAWQWWFQLFGCFTALYLLFVNLLQGERRLAAFGALWFCGSAYVATWSQWAAYSTFFAALLTLTTYHIVTTRRLWVMLAHGAGLGLALPGFAMCSYPPWQVPLGWLALALLGWMLWRDGALRRWPEHWLRRAASLLLAVALAAGLMASYLHAALPAMKALLGTVYPGSRFHAGGDYSFVWLLRGYYNVWTNFVSSRGFHNISEASSFIHLFPPVFLALLVSRRVRQAMGGLGWVAVLYLLFMLLYAMVGLPGWLAAATMLSRSHPPRVDIGIGLASILLCLWVLKQPAEAPAPASRHERWVPAGVAAAMALLGIVHGVLMRKHTGSYPGWALMLPMALVLAAASFSLLTARRRLFMTIVGTWVVVTSYAFNPLAIGTASVRDSEFVRAVARVRQSPADSFVCYEPEGLIGLCGALTSVAGGRSLGGIHQYPRLELWRALDPGGENAAAYNRYAHVIFKPCAEASCLSFEAPGDDFWASSGGLPPNTFHVHVSPRHPALSQVGVRYAIAVGEMQREPAFADLQQAYRSVAGQFTIYALPAP